MRLIDNALAYVGLRGDVGRLWPPRRLSLALQGGGSFGAFTWGVLDRLLEEADVTFDAISGSSAGAVNAVVLAAGLIDGGRTEAKARLERFWRRMSAAAAFLPRASFGETPIGAGLGLVARSLSPYQFNPFNLNPLREVLTAAIDFDLLRAGSPMKLLIGATRVRDGRLRIFTEGELSVDAVLASACLPLIHHAIEIGGEPYWDGGYAANPPLLPLVQASRAAHLLVVQVTPNSSERLPTTTREIAKRVRADPIQRDAEFRTRSAQIRHDRRRDAEAAPPAHRPHLGARRIRRPRRRKLRQSRLAVPRKPARKRPQRRRGLAGGRRAARKPAGSRVGTGGGRRRRGKPKRSNPDSRFGLLRHRSRQVPMSFPQPSRSGARPAARPARRLAITCRLSQYCFSGDPPIVAPWPAREIPSAWTAPGKAPRPPF